MRDFEYGCMHAMAMPAQNHQPAMVMPQTQMPMPQMAAPQMVMPPQLENMYPKTYNIIKPVAENVCENMLASCGAPDAVSPEQVEAMVNEVYTKVEKDVEAAVKDSPMETERQFYGPGRRVFRDFITALILSSLIARRRPFYGYPGYGYPGYGYPGYGYPGYGYPGYGYPGYGY